MKKKVELRLSHPEHSTMFLCEKCFSWDGEFRIKASMNCEALWIQVSCLCNSIKCNNCKNTRLMPDSCVWNLEDDYFAHVLNFTGIRPCSKCGSKMAINQIWIITILWNVKLLEKMVKVLLQLKLDEKDSHIKMVHYVYINIIFSGILQSRWGNFAHRYLTGN